MPIIKPSRHFEGSDLGLVEPVILSGTDVAEVVHELVGPVTWTSDDEGFCECPGKHLHSTRNAGKDCKIYLRPIASLTCFHGSCRVVVQETARRLRQGITQATGLASYSGSRLTEEQKAQQAKMRAKEALRQRAATTRHRLLQEYPWPYAEILGDSPVRLDADATGHWRNLLGLFAAEDVIWTGSIYDSGKPSHGVRFRFRDEWLVLSEVPAQFVCASTFHRGSYARGNDNVARRPFLVVESDELDRDTIGAVFRWMTERVKMNLRCIVDTAGKSLHGWFDYPPPDELEDLRIVLPELGCDPKMFTASQPCRLPGARREDKLQKLIYLNTEVAP